MGPATLQNLLNNINNTTDLTDWTTSFEEKPAPLVALPADPVACACASYRVWKENPARRWEDIETVVVWQDDIDEAERLKKYYRDRMIIQTLKSTNGITRSRFKQKLAKLVVNELPITKTEIGLLCRLPYFYEEDLALDSIVADTNDSAVQGTMCHAYRGIFTPLKTVLVSRSTGDYYHYWFTDSKRTPYSLVIRTDNPLRNMFEVIYKKGPMHLHANIYPKNMRGYRNHRYYQLESVELA
jgi:hypothetical protein